MQYTDRREAGMLLARELEGYAGRDDLIVLALPRGGVPVGYEVAKALHAPLDVFVVRKLGFPGHEELAMGAIASGGIRTLNKEVLANTSDTGEMIEEVSRRETAELERREKVYRGERPFPDVQGRTVILVDDGLATGATMRAAAKAIRMKDPARVVIAVPIGAPSTCEELGAMVDDLICLSQPSAFFAVGQGYDDFSQTSDDEVRMLLSKAAAV